MKCGITYANQLKLCGRNNSSRRKAFDNVCAEDSGKYGTRDFSHDYRVLEAYSKMVSYSSKYEAYSNVTVGLSSMVASWRLPQPLCQPLLIHRVMMVLVGGQQILIVL